MRGEFWLPVEGFNGIYEVSNVGRVRSLPRMVKTRGGGSRRYAGKILSPTMNSGYLKVTLSVDGVATVACVHVMVLEAFVRPRPGPARSLHGCHNDGDVTRNHVGNLRWDTVSANALDAVKHGTALKGTERPGNKLTEDEVLEIRRLSSRETVSSLARSYGVDRKTIRKIRDGQSWAWLNSSKPTLHTKPNRSTA